MSDIIFSWPISSYYGWGIRGLNYALSWDGTAVSAMVPDRPELGESDSRRKLLADRVGRSLNFQQHILSSSGATVEIAAPVLVPLGNGFQRIPVAHARDLRGHPWIACPVFEDEGQAKANVERLKEYDRVVVASNWNREVLESLGIAAVLCYEGVDPVLFNPAVRRVRGDGRFRVFSGGKAEYRKGQDIVISAFKRFAEKHDDAVLVTAWGSPFGFHGRDFDRTEYGAPPGSHIGKPNFAAWLQKAGLKPHQYEIVPPLPNWRMPEVYGGVDVAVFPNRKEGGTNFVLMEAMACGVPCGITHGHGHTDLGLWPAEFQAVCFDYRNDGDLIEEISRWLGAHKEHYSTKATAKYWTWDRHTKQMAEIIAGV